MYLLMVFLISLKYGLELPPPILETLSVMIQVAFYKKTGKRVFKMAPIHHHFELSGWNENKIVSVFSIITLGLSVLSILVI